MNFEVVNFHLVNWLRPEILEKRLSKYNGEMEVVRFAGKNSLNVSGVQQSGPWVEKVWERGLHRLALDNTDQIRHILILGLGAGSVAKVVNRKWPKAKIVGVEIDPVMVVMGKKYFGQDKVGNLQVIIGDAQAHKTTSWLPGKFGKRYDLIIVDLYVGKNYPSQFERSEFLKKLSQTVSKMGRVIFNRLTTRDSNFVLADFVDKLEKFFKIEKTLKVDFNTLIYCSRK